MLCSVGTRGTFILSMIEKPENISVFLENEYADVNSVLTTEAGPEEEKVEMETEFSEEDDENEYYMNFSMTEVSEEVITTAPIMKNTMGQDESGSTNLNYDEDGQTEAEEPPLQEKYSVIDKIIEEEQKTPGERLLEKIEKSKVLERILPQTEEPDRDSLLSRIIKMFGK